VSRALIRFAKRLASWEDPSLSLDELQRLEFKARDGGPDLRPSVYEVDDFAVRAVQSYAEHAHAFDPPRTALALDVDDAVLGNCQPTPGDTPFAFTREAHREIVLHDDADLLEFIGRVKSMVRRYVSKTDVQLYVRGRLDSGDREWTTVASNPDAKGWVRKLAAKR